MDIGYKHGTYADLEKSIVKTAIKSNTVACYVGIAPVNLTRGWAVSGVINRPVKLNDYTDAQKKIGWSTNWDSFTLCEAVGAHFDNGLENIGPIYVINVLNPAVHRKAEATNVSVTFTNGVANFVSDTVILDTVTIDSFTTDTDFTVDYDYDANKVILTAINTNLTGTKTVAFYEVDTDEITKTEIIGGETAAGVVTGLAALKFMYLNENKVTNLLGAPKFSEEPDVYAAMIKACNGINGHWQSWFYADIPTQDGDTAVDTMVKARNWRSTNGYDSERSEIFWPKWKDNKTGRIYHFSTLAIVKSMITDYSHNSVPFESCSNKEIPSGEQYINDDIKNQYDESQVTKDLNAYGISSGVYWGGKCVLWGGHTAKFQDGADIDARAYDTHYMRMLFHCMNGFQLRNASRIDGNFNRNTKDSILDSEQEILDTYIAQGGLLDGSRIIFDETSNPESDMIHGDFVFNINASVTPRTKSLTGKVAYTDEGLSSIYGEGE